jgi:hypothetical protein
MKSKKVLGIGIDGVVRDYHSQFDKMYRKEFIRNESLVDMDDNFTYVPKSFTEEDYKAIERIEREKITLPIDTYDLLNHYYFENREALEKFYFEDYAFEIYGSATQFPRSMDIINRLQAFGEGTGLFDVKLISVEKEKAVTATYHFLSKSGCRIKNVLFVNNHFEKWNHCDVMIDDCPEVFESKPSDKTSIKIAHPYNQYNEADYFFNSVNEIFSEEFLHKIFSKQ